MRASLTSFFAALAAAALIAGCASTTTDDQTAAPVTESGRSGSEAARSQGIQSTPVKPVDVTGQPGETVDYTVTVTNNAAYTIQTWTVSWSYGAGQAIIAGSPYGANVTQSGTTVTATPAAPAPETTTRSDEMSRPSTLAAPISAASATIAVPC